MSEEKTELTGEAMDSSKLADLLWNPEKVDIKFPNEHIKSWGIEKWIHNDVESGYCMKTILVYQDYWSSKGKFHYHKLKDETFLVVYGTLKLDVEVDGVIRQLHLGPWESYRVKPGMRHRFTSAGTSCKFIEASTTHREEDSYRCYWDHVAQQWIDD